MILLFLAFFSVIYIPRDVSKALELPGETFLVVKKPRILEKPFINLNDEMQDVVFGSLWSFLTGKGLNVPWYADEEYISSNAIFCYNTKHGVVIDREFFDKPRP